MIYFNIDNIDDNINIYDTLPLIFISTHFITFIFHFMTFILLCYAVDLKIIIDR
jgi:hypothetical protein